jgi:hypothetical protein
MWKEGILPDLNAKGVQLDALKRLAAKKFEEDYTVKVVDRLLREAWISLEDREVYREQILDIDNDISDRLNMISLIKQMIGQVNIILKDRHKVRGVFLTPEL